MASDSSHKVMLLPTLTPLWLCRQPVESLLCSQSLSLLLLLVLFVVVGAAASASAAAAVAAVVVQVFVAALARLTRLPLLAQSSNWRFCSCFGSGCCLSLPNSEAPAQAQAHH